jgi:flagellar biosynthesis/type III secretory pathway M-ring protein FliF/YscJ
MEPRAKRHKSNVFKRISRWFTKLSKAKKIAVITVAVLLISASGASAWYYNRLSDMEGLFPEVNWPGGEDGPDTIA